MSGPLDELVHDYKGEEAAAINNAGIDAQVEYLLGVDDSPIAFVRGQAHQLRAQFRESPEVLAAIDRAIEKAKKRGDA